MDFLTKLLGSLSDILKTILPTSPFADMINEFSGIPYLGYLNWFVPVGGIIKVFSAFLTAYGLFQLYGIFLRWMKVIGD